MNESHRRYFWNRFIPGNLLSFLWHSSVETSQARSEVSSLATLRLGGREGGRAPGSSFGKLPWKAAVVTLAAAVCHLRTFILHPIGRIAEADMVDYHSSAVELTLQSTFFISFLVRLFFYNVPADFYLTLTAVIWVNGEPHHICTATNLLQIEKMYTVPLKISLGLSANMWWGPPGRRKADPSL